MPRPPLDIVQTLGATPEQVWDALTTAEGLTNWFPVNAAVTPGAGGTISMSWQDGEYEGTLDIEVWEPGRRLRLTYAFPGEDGPVAMAQEFVLDADGGGTRLRLVHSGFGDGPGWDRWYEGTRRGWAFELRGLTHYLERHAGQRRQLVQGRRYVEDDLTALWDRLTGPDGLALGGDTRPGGAFHARLPGGPQLLGVLDIHGPPRDLAGRVTSLDDAFLRLKLDEAWLRDDAREVNVWFSLYAQPEETVIALQASVDQLLDALFPAPLGR